MTEEQQKAMEFATSPRGQWIISQALYHAIKVLEVQNPDQKEESNIRDMKFLRDTLYSAYEPSDNT